MPIEDLARSEVVTAHPNTSITEVAQLMDEKQVGSVVITNEETPVGIVTDRDLTTRILTQDEPQFDQTAEDVMTSGLCSVGPNAGFFEAAQTMGDNGVRRLPICNDNGELVGIITADDLTELLAEEHQVLSKIIQAQRPAYETPTQA